MIGRAHTVRPLARWAPVAVSYLVASLLLVSQAAALTAQQSNYLKLAERGVAQAKRTFKDARHGIWNGKRNVPVSWFDERLGSHMAYPLATIWGSVALFESLSAIASANPTAANRAALDAFAEGTRPAARPPGARIAKRPGPANAAAGARVAWAHTATVVYGGAESYWDPAMGAFAPYPGDRGPANTWFDDNAWWGIAFIDAYKVLHKTRLLQDAQDAFQFIARRGWDGSGGGGLFWNTYHSPGGQKSGEALAAGSLLGALLAGALKEAAASAPGRAKAAYMAAAGADTQTVEKFLGWGDSHFTGNFGGLYSRTQFDNTPMPYVAGPEIEAKQLLCTELPNGNPYCAQARQVADAAFKRFAYRLDMGPQFDVIYLHWMLVYGQQAGDGRWAPMALHFASEGSANARAASGLYLRAWDGTDMSGHQAEPNMLRTDAATVELFGWLAADVP
jgi:hypothetical protein